MGSLGYILALFWGFSVAVALQFTALGRFLAEKRTWVTAVGGVGGDLAIMVGMVSWESWWPMAGVVLASSAGVIFRSLWNELAEARAEAEQVGKADKPRLPNKVLWNVQDVEAICPRVQERLRHAEEFARQKDEARLIAELAQVGREVERVLRKARDIRYGEYCP